MIQDILIFYLLWVLGAPAWCFVAICIAVLLRIINFGMNIGAKQEEKAINEALKRLRDETIWERDKR